MGLNQMTQAQFDALKTTLKVRFNAGLKLSNEDWKKIAKAITSDGKSNTYEWLSAFPAFREWIGKRLHKVLSETAYNVVNRKFETTIDIKVEDIEDDNVGQYGGIAESHGQAATDLLNDLVFQAVVAGFNSLCYDGQYFFDTDHPVYPNEDGSGVPTTQSNMQEGTGAPWVLLCTKRAASPIYLQERSPVRFDSLTSLQNSQVFDYDMYSFGGRWRGEVAYGFYQCAFGSKADLTADNFNAAYGAMMKMKGDGNRKLGIVGDTLLVGPDLQSKAEALLKAQQNAAGASNTNYNKVQLIVTPWM
ncbi:Mu-like prophage major head subunit gpT family protein [Herbaspirillum sp.]|uniref:Mu-like prophage major head subunit gpT family protein n=1 Tax=Herbaspirillum sp. TaxID=1890675 RepID=UPI001B24CFEA|nr:Mu-like prophage major head subunit gpT family protein [Herbaspirillum sp.]MBO9538759.1 Mu-like prophage major head subunit gpT family protein [Herbaspirillum sp.]